MKFLSNDTEELLPTAALTAVKMEIPHFGFTHDMNAEFARANAL